MDELKGKTQSELVHCFSRSIKNGVCCKFPNKDCPHNKWHNYEELKGTPPFLGCNVPCCGDGICLAKKEILEFRDELNLILEKQ